MEPIRKFRKDTNAIGGNLIKILIVLLLITAFLISCYYENAGTITEKFVDGDEIVRYYFVIHRQTFLHDDYWYVQVSPEIYNSYVVGDTINYTGISIDVEKVNRRLI